ncbi:MFS transporter [Mycobacterium sp. pUA109]|uniref:MFS transporter n=1 Tax=Mycobacterium sp. pUA109 TaxID=3238982 RepID=UPI00351AD06E
MGIGLGRQFGWLWTAYAVSTAGTWLAFDAFPMIAILVLHATASQVALLAAAGLAVGALVAVPLGSWVEFRRKRPVMIATDLIRCVALLSVPVEFLCGALGFTQLVVVSIVVATADVTFTAASGAYLKRLLAPPQLLPANARFESTTWAATILGPPLGGAAIGILGPACTVVANAVSFLVSAVAIGAISGTEPRRPRPRGRRARDLLEGWRIIATHPTLRPLFVNTVAVNGLIMAPAPLLAALMLGPLGFPPWQYALTFALPCLGGIVGSRLAHPLVARFGQPAVLRTVGVVRACWPLGLAAVAPGLPGLVLVIVVQLGLVTCCGIFNPVLATHRLEQLPTSHATRAVAAWSISTKVSIAALTGLWAGLAALAGPRIAIAAAGLLLLATPLLLPRPSAWHDAELALAGAETG